MLIRNRAPTLAPQNAVVFTNKMAKLSKTIKADADLTYINGTIVGNYSAGLGHAETLGPPMAWWEFAKDGSYAGIEASVEYVLEFINEHGPFDGILGFEQGATFAAYLMLLWPPKRPPLSFLILISALFPNDTTIQIHFQPSFHDPPLRTLHVMGQQDPHVSVQSSMRVAQCFDEPELVTHTGGHELPQTKMEMEDIKTFLREVMHPTSPPPAKPREPDPWAVDTVAGDPWAMETAARHPWEECEEVERRNRRRRLGVGLLGEGQLGEGQLGVGLLGEGGLGEGLLGEGGLGEGGLGEGGLGEGGLEAAAEEEAWYSAWQERLQCWWHLLTPLAQQHVGSCMGALGLSLSSRFDAMLNGRVPPKRSASSAQSSGRCAWVEGDFEHLQLPSFPQMGNLEFQVPALPRLLPNWMQTHSRVPRAIDTPSRLDSQEEPSISKQPAAASTVTLVGAGAGFAAGAIVGLLACVGAAGVLRARRNRRPQRPAISGSK